MNSAEVIAAARILLRRTSNGAKSGRIQIYALDSVTDGAMRKHPKRFGEEQELERREDCEEIVLIISREEY